MRRSKETGGKAEILIERIEGQRSALAHLRASKSPKPGSRLLVHGGAEAEVTGRDGELFTLRFSTDILPYLDEYGAVPLPPYLEREADESDVERYQTVYAKDPEPSRRPPQDCTSTKRCWRKLERPAYATRA